MTPLLLIITMGPAWAACPPVVADYTAQTMPTLSIRYLDDIGYWDDLGCTLGDEQCFYGVVTPSAPAVEKDSLLLFLPGAGGSPFGYRHLGNMAGFAGYKSIFLLWDNDVSVGELCAGATPFLGGDCPTTDANDCQRIVRDELLAGRDDLTSTAYSPLNRLGSIVHRLAMALSREAALDVTNQWDWGRYCTPDPEHGTAIHWDQVVLAGHSFGGNQAAYIAYRNETQGAFVIDSGYDVCEADLPVSIPFDVYDDPDSDYNMTGVETLWYETFTNATSRWVFALHETDIFPTVVWPELPPSMAYYVPGAVDTNGEPVAGTLFDDDGSGSYVDEVFISTSQLPANDQQFPYDPCPSVLPEHASMASDRCLPNGGDFEVEPSSVPGTSSLKLFHAYVSALCELGN